MEAGSKTINLEDISNIPNPEFAKHFYDWLQEDHIARSLQAKLRKDLIDNFNKTELGSYIRNSKTYKNSIVSPLLLVTNALIAEFLYAENCHYTLSVFCTEIPYQNTLPDFERSRQFSFTETELNEIFTTILPSTPPFSNEFKQTIIQEYLRDSSSAKQFRDSLLLCILKKIKEFQKLKTNQNNGQDEITLSTITASNTDTKNPLNLNAYRCLRKFTAILSKKIQEISLQLRNVEGKSSNSIVTLRNKKFRHINRNLDKISKNLKNLCTLKKGNCNLTKFMNTLKSVTQNFENLTQEIGNLSQKLEKFAENSDISGIKEKSYEDWLNEVKTTKSGKKFLSKVENCLIKILDRERQEIYLKFEKKYEEKLSQIFNKYLPRNDDNDEEQKIKTENIRKSVEQKLQEFNEVKTVFPCSNENFEEKDGRKEPEILSLQEEKYVTKSDQKIQTEPLNLCNERSNTEIFTTKQNEKVDNIISLQEQILKKLTDSQEIIPKFCEQDSQKYNTEAINKSKCVDDTVLEQLKPQLHKVTKDILQKEKNIDEIIYDAKLRIKELEYENNEVNKTLQGYLERHKCEKTKIDENMKLIWENYKLDKTMLQKKCEAIKLTRSIHKQQNELENFDIDQFIISNKNKNTSKENDVNLMKSSNHVIQQSNDKLNFKNPFKELHQRFFQYNEYNEYINPILLPFENATNTESNENILSNKHENISEIRNHPTKMIDDTQIHSKMFVTHKKSRKLIIDVEHNKIDSDLEGKSARHNDNEINTCHELAGGGNEAAGNEITSSSSSKQTIKSFRLKRNLFDTFNAITKTVENASNNSSSEGHISKENVLKNEEC